jgi:hypothetical protein
VKAVCQCGHKITMKSAVGQEKFWKDYAKKCLCKECYEIKTGRSCNKDAVMVNDPCLIQ